MPKVLFIKRYKELCARSWKMRNDSPKGVNFAITVVVAFHPSGFITKNDRAFNVQCFYNEPEEVVTNSIQVSSLPTLELHDEMNLPTCSYSVRSGSHNGPLLSYASVGETLFHVWECKKCFVTDGDGDEHLVIDEKGCSSDQSLLDSVVYHDNLMRAHAQSQAFKFADTNQLFFTCQIRLCQKQMSMCEGVTPPKCDGSTNSTKSKETDLIETDSNESGESTESGESSSESKSDDKVEEAEEDIESSLDSESTTELKNQTKKRDRRELLQMVKPLELDVTTPQLLIVDQEERNFIYSSQTCISKSLLPLLPISFVTTIAMTVLLTLSLYKHCFVTQKSLLFY
ncbi:Zona pellucida domain-containing protein [Aphelenchoides bicaudatus]|nr:Zona pellucida domain-containing protein [Aphelenchoides bicaudatus]